MSSDYVFDGTVELHTEEEPFSPLGVYGQTKAAGDALVSTLPRHYIVRTSWVIGDGNNFVKTMASLADRGIEPGVVDDQYGRLTFTDDLAAGIAHLVGTDAPFGTYNLSSDGPVQTWADIARDVFAARGRPAERREQRVDRGLRRRQAARPAAATQRARPGQDHRDRVSAPIGSRTLQEYLARL